MQEIRNDRRRKTRMRGKAVDSTGRWIGEQTLPVPSCRVLGSFVSQQFLAFFHPFLHNSIYPATRNLFLTNSLTQEHLSNGSPRKTHCQSTPCLVLPPTARERSRVYVRACRFFFAWTERFVRAEERESSMHELRNKKGDG